MIPDSSDDLDTQILVQWYKEYSNRRVGCEAYGLYTQHTRLEMSE
jgi:hypothetical protein